MPVLLFKRERWGRLLDLLAQQPLSKGAPLLHCAVLASSTVSRRAPALKCQSTVSVVRAVRIARRSECIRGLFLRPLYNTDVAG